jgi:UDP-N-acetylglucosamine transferase subunit ALG13
MASGASPQVLVSVGTDKHPFDRLVEWVDRWAAEHRDVEVFIQYGASRAPSFADGTALLSHVDLLAMIGTADVVISHGGPSTVMDIRSRGRLPIVVGRDPDFGEHVDGHQLRFAAHLGKHRMALLPRDEVSLHDLIDGGLAEPGSRELDVDGDARPAGIVAFSDHMNTLLGITNGTSR